LQAVPECKQAFLPKEKTQPKQVHQSVGIEHASIDDIQAALSRVAEAAQKMEQSNIRKEDLIERGLIGGQGAQAKRQYLGEVLEIGYTNGKQLLKRLEMYRVQLKTLDEVLLKLEGQNQ